MSGLRNRLSDTMYIFPQQSDICKGKRILWPIMAKNVNGTGVNSPNQNNSSHSRLGSIAYPAIDMQDRARSHFGMKCVRTMRGHAL